MPYRTKHPSFPPKERVPHRCWFNNYLSCGFLRFGRGEGLGLRDMNLRWLRSGIWLGRRRILVDRVRGEIVQALGDLRLGVRWYYVMDVCLGEETRDFCLEVSRTVNYKFCLHSSQLPSRGQCQTNPKILHWSRCLVSRKRSQDCARRNLDLRTIILVQLTPVLPRPSWGLHPPPSVWQIWEWLSLVRYLTTPLLIRSISILI